MIKNLAEPIRRTRSRILSTCIAVLINAAFRYTSIVASACLKGVVSADLTVQMLSLLSINDILNLNPTILTHEYKQIPINTWLASSHLLAGSFDFFFFLFLITKTLLGRAKIKNADGCDDTPGPDQHGYDKDEDRKNAAESVRTDPG
jgi:hypothetical protein